MAKPKIRGAASDAAAAVSGAIEVLSAGIIRVEGGPERDLTFGHVFVPTEPIGVRVAGQLGTALKYVVGDDDETPSMPISVKKYRKAPRRRPKYVAAHLDPDLAGKKSHVGRYVVTRDSLKD